MSNAIGKVDFHLHSYASNVTDYYAANAFAIPESYSDPLKLHPLLKQRGMTLVTLTDHNSINGALDMLNAGLPDVFISAEMTTTFPEDGCNIHITIANVTPEQFREADSLRKNIYEMVAYLDLQIAEEQRSPSGNRLMYFMTHPLMSTQNRPYGREGSLTLAHIEKAILLCNTFEIRNGGRTKAINDLAASLFNGLTPSMIERFSIKHGIAPKGDIPWLKGFVGGSDDHSGINPGRTWTTFDSAAGYLTPNALIDCMRRRETRPEGSHGGPVTLAHSLLKLLYDGSKRTSVAKSNPMLLSGPIHSLLQLVFDSEPESVPQKIRRKIAMLGQMVAGRWALHKHGLGVPFEDMLEAEVRALLASPEFRATLAFQKTSDDRIFLVISTLINRIFARYVSNLKQQHGLNLVAAIKEIVTLVASNLFVSLPYLVAFLQQASDCMVAHDVRESFRFAEPRKLALLTDTFFDVNGVSVSIKRMINEAMRRNIEFTVITCLSAEEQKTYCAQPDVQRFIEAGRLKIFTSVANLDFPEYDGLQIRFPPLLDLLKYLQEEGFTKMQISTPGTTGLAGLLAAKTLQIETAATYHTNIPEYVENYTRDVSLEALAWKYMMLFYHAVDEVIVPSRSTAKLLHKRGLRKRKLLLLDRWVDVDRFHPGNRTPGYWEQYGIENEDRLVKFIYVGRIGVEKNLQLIASAYRQLLETRKDAHLIFVGEGPYLRDLEKLLWGLPVTFTGILQGSELCQAIASADVKLFPSTTDTWGNAPLEAQASGLPVIVSEVGGPIELIMDAITGLKIKGRSAEELCEAMLKLMDESTRSTMGQMARAFAVANRVDEPFSAILDAEAHRRRIEERKQAAQADFMQLRIQESGSGPPSRGASPGMSINPFRKIGGRILLSRAKHRSLQGHPRMARRIARWIPAYSHSESTFFWSDGAPPDIERRRREGFKRLAALFQQRFPKTIALTQGLQAGISDLAFVNAHRVPFQYRQFVQDHLEIGAIADTSDGPRVRDIDGNWSYDIGGSYGTNLFGSDFYKQSIDRGVERARALGLVLGSYHPVIADNVARLQQISGLDEVSFHMSGTEAVMQAVRLAQYHTRRSHAVRFSGAYHGWWDGVQAGIGSPRPARGIYTLKEMHPDTLRVIQTRDDIACVLVNPVQAMNPNGSPATDSALLASDRTFNFDKASYTRWLQDLRRICTLRSIVLIFDEVFAGFRLARCGAQEYFGVRADMVTYGKSLGGGLPIGVVCGKSALMRRYNDSLPMDICFARGTFNSHPYVMATMNEFLRHLDEPDVLAGYEQLEAVWNGRARELNKSLERLRLPVRVANMISIWTTLYTQPSRYNWMFQFYLRAEGLALSWIGTGRFIFSHDLKDSDFDEIAKRFVAAAQAMDKDGWWWKDAALTNKSIKRRVVRELISARLGRLPWDRTTGPLEAISAPYGKSSRRAADPSESW